MTQKEIKRQIRIGRWITSDIVELKNEVRNEKIGQRNQEKEIHKKKFKGLGIVGKSNKST